MSLMLRHASTAASNKHKFECKRESIIITTIFFPRRTPLPARVTPSRPLGGAVTTSPSRYSLGCNWNGSTRFGQPYSIFI